MSLYLILNILIILVPFLLSFEKNISFCKKFKPYLLSISIVSPAYIIWDSIATSRGDWGFNPDYLLGINLFYLPIEEILFFVTVPYSCIFIYETVKFYLPEKEIKIPSWVIIVFAAILIILSAIFYDQYYTATVMSFSALFLLAGIYFQKELLSSSVYWITLLITYFPFLVVNYVLTSMPVVWYNDDAIWGSRLSTIPYEDFIYSFSMISWWLFFYNFGKKKFKVK
jgi:lycopene cyclase domain-containing protein